MRIVEIKFEQLTETGDLLCLTNQDSKSTYTEVMARRF